MTRAEVVERSAIYCAWCLGAATGAAIEAYFAAAPMDALIGILVGCALSIFAVLVWAVLQPVTTDAATLRLQANLEELRHFLRVVDSIGTAPASESWRPSSTIDQWRACICQCHRTADGGVAWPWLHDPIATATACRKCAPLHEEHSRRGPCE